MATFPATTKGSITFTPVGSTVNNSGYVIPVGGTNNWANSNTNATWPSISGTGTTTTPWGVGTSYPSVTTSAVYAMPNVEVRTYVCEYCGEKLVFLISIPATIQNSLISYNNGVNYGGIDEQAGQLKLFKHISNHIQKFLETETMSKKVQLPVSMKLLAIQRYFLDLNELNYSLIGDPNITIPDVNKNIQALIESAVKVVTETIFKAFCYKLVVFKELVKGF